MNTKKRLICVNCTGCAACYSVCPQHAISMHEDSEGFLYPVIDVDKCTDCELCEERCPVLSKDNLPINREKPDVYIAWHNNLEIRLQSSSGGAFTALATAVLNTGGIVFGAAFDDKFLVYHKPVEHLDDLKILRGSKYMQSRIGDNFRQAQHFLDKGQQVLFSGVACQIAGLYAYLGREYDNLYTCNLVCKGVPSPKVFRKYLDYMETRFDSKVASYSFRDKRYSWALNEAITFINGQKKYSSYFKHEVPYYYGFAVESLFSRRSCYSCPFKGLPTVADITLADFWSIRKQEPKWNDEKGTSLILVNSDKGNSLFQKSQVDLLTKQCPFAYIESNSNLMGSARCPRKRKTFFKELDRLPFEMLIEKYMTPSSYIFRYPSKLTKRLKNMIKRMIGRK